MITKQEAIAQGLGRYDSPTVCKNGHQGLRFVSNSECCTCAKERYQSDEFKAKRRARNKVNREKLITQKKASYLRNKESILDKNKQYRLNNKDRSRVYFALYKKENAAKVRALNSKRNASKLDRTPNWIDSEELWLMKEIFELATLREKETGFKWHVDHIIPLLGKKVSGLHVPENLQVIPWIDNLIKSNSYEVV